MSFSKRFFALTLALLTSLSTAVAASDDHLPGRVYFTVSENHPEVWDLLTWVQSRTRAPRPPERYSRLNHFGGWIDPASEPSCLNIRGLVLTRESLGPVRTFPDQPCFVQFGRWYDPYTNRQFNEAKALQIDHVVPLKNAYISGAFKWDWKTRCAYTNFMADRTHLIAIDSSTNMSKADKTPAGYMPPNPAHRCQYLANWLKVKLVWRLWISEPEAKAIETELIRGKCNESNFRISKRDVLRLRQMIVATREECPESPDAFKVPPGSIIQPQNSGQ